MKGYTKRFLAGLYEMMLTIRICEESLVDPIVKKEVLCPVHLCTGQEAVAAGVCAALQKKDHVFGNHRSHGHYLAKGGPLEDLIAEIYGKETGCSRGRGGSMHVCDPATGFLGAAPIVAGTIALALGSALASSIRKDGRVTVSFFGDGACGEGVLYESFNFAALKSLPLIFVCENNLYSTHLSILECRPTSDVRGAGQACSVRSLSCDGNDVLQVYETARKAHQLCRKGCGPVFIECKTYRMRGHVGPNDNIQGAHTDIRPQREIEAWRKKDPLRRFEKLLARHQVLKKGEIEKIRLDVQTRITEAFRYAHRSPYPKKEELSRYVFSESQA